MPAASDPLLPQGQPDVAEHSDPCRSLNIGTQVQARAAAFAGIRDLGMDPSTRGSAAFIGLKYLDAFRRLSPSDFNRFKNAIERGDLPVTHFNRIVTEHSSPALLRSRARIRQRLRRGGERSHRATAAKESSWSDSTSPLQRRREATPRSAYGPTLLVSSPITTH